MKQLALRQSQERANLYLPEHGTQVDTCAPIIHNSQHPQTLSHSFPFTQGQCQDAQPLDMGVGQSLKYGIQEEAWSSLGEREQNRWWKCSAQRGWRPGD